MIKRIIGVVFTIAVFAVVIAAAINFGQYRSMVFNFRHQSEPEEVVRVEEPEQIEADSTAMKKAKKKQKLTPEQIEARKKAMAKKKAEAAKRRAAETEQTAE